MDRSCPDWSRTGSAATCGTGPCTRWRRRRASRSGGTRPEGSTRSRPSRPWRDMPPRSRTDDDSGPASRAPGDAGRARPPGDGVFGVLRDAPGGHRAGGRHLPAVADLLHRRHPGGRRRLRSHLLVGHPVPPPALGGLRCARLAVPREPPARARGRTPSRSGAPTPASLRWPTTATSSTRSSCTPSSSAKA